MVEAVAADAVVVGAGHNGLVAANLLADAGWDVLVLEAQPVPGGAVRSADYLGADVVADMCSAFYPLVVVSPVFRRLGLEDHGLRWRHAPAVLAHPQPDGHAAMLWRDLDRTTDRLNRSATGDGDAWRRLVDLWERLSPALLAALSTPFPPVRAGLRLAGQLRAAGGLRAARLATLPVRRLVDEEFAGADAPLLLAGCALHADLAPESAGSAVLGWLLAMLGQQVGFPVPAGGAGRLTDALVRRLGSRGGTLRCGTPVRRVIVSGGRAVGVETDGGERVMARNAVLADVPAPALYGGLVDWEHLPARLRDDIRRFQWDYATVKVDWSLSGPIPWTAAETAEAGTVHLAADLDEMTIYTAQLATGRVPDRPFVLLGQMTRADPSRAPAGTEVVWAYTHVPQRVRADAGDDQLDGRWDERQHAVIADRIEAQIERFAPGFRNRVQRRHVLCPPDLAEHDGSLVGGAINGGTAAMHQQLVFRPTPGLGRPETPVAGLYLASASAHPGGAVHGACGANAARAALRGHRGLARVVLPRALAAAQRVLLGPD